jgi:hypothetical protein
MCERTGNNETVLSAWDTVARRKPANPDTIKTQRAALRTLCRVAPEDNRPDLDLLAESGKVTVENGKISIDFRRIRHGELRSILVSLSAEYSSDSVDDHCAPCSCVVCRRGSINE